jgi:hypothetical protein
MTIPGACSANWAGQVSGAAPPISLSGDLAAIPGACSAEWAGQVSSAAPPSACNAASLGTSPVPGVQSIVSLILFLRLEYSITFLSPIFFFQCEWIFLLPVHDFYGEFNQQLVYTTRIQLKIFVKILKNFKKETVSRNIEFGCEL